jgi:hypothetical protein
VPVVSSRIQQDLLRELDRLPPDQQQRVVEFARALAASEQKGAPGDVLLKHFGVISPADAREILGAVEEGCERVDPGEW